MNNHMRSTKTKFYNPKDKKGAGTFTGTKIQTLQKNKQMKVNLINLIH